MTNEACGSLKRPNCWIWNIRSPPLIYSMTKNKWPYYKYQVKQNDIMCTYNSQSTNTDTAAYLCLESRVEGSQEGWLFLESQYTLLNQCTLNVIILDNNILFQHFDSKKLVLALQLSQHHLLQHVFTSHDHDNKREKREQHTFPKLPLPRTTKKLKSDSPNFL